MRRYGTHKIKVLMTKIKVIIEDQSFVTYKLCVSHNSKTSKGNLIKLHRKIKQNEKVCCAQNLVSHDQGQGHNRRSNVGHLQIVSAITQKSIEGIQSNFTER